LYFNTTSDAMRVYNGTAWQDTSTNPNSPTFNGTVTADGLTVNADALIHGVTVGRGAGAVSTNTAVGSMLWRLIRHGNSNTANGYEALNKTPTEITTQLLVIEVFTQTPQAMVM
jgi:hypothetical protein